MRIYAFMTIRALAPYYFALQIVFFYKNILSIHIITVPLQPQIRAYALVSTGKKAEGKVPSSIG